MTTFQARHAAVTVLLVLFSSLSVLSYPYGSPGYYCSRSPNGHQVPKTPGDNGFVLGLAGSPAVYQPGRSYQLFLTAAIGTFKGFVISALKPDIFREQPAGTFEVFDHLLMKTTDNCPYLITHSSPSEKTEVSVHWTAPPAGTGCVTFRATVVETKLIWYQDDGTLSLQICEQRNSTTVPNFSPTAVKECCACGSASYLVTFQGLWERMSHPKEFPTAFLTRWSPVIGASHSRNFTIWQYGERASEAVQRIAEWGDSRLLESLMRSHSSSIRSVIKMRGLLPPDLTGTISASFSVTQQHHLLSLLSELVPSPDWCVGTNSYDLCTPNCDWVESDTISLFPWDAGTDGGVTYMSANDPMSVKKPIQSIISMVINSTMSPFYNPANDPVNPFARISLKRISTTGSASCRTQRITADEEAMPEDMMIECETSLWADWSSCSTPCGDGTRTRERLLLQSSPQCFQTELRQSRSCHDIQGCVGVSDMIVVNADEEPTQSPDAPRDCLTSDWSVWSECSRTCGRGQMLRTRTIKIEPLNGGVECPDLLETKRCQYTGIECAVDCVLGPWDDWTSCSKSCGDGTQKRRRERITNARFGGKACDARVERRVCNLGECV